MCNSKKSKFINKQEAKGLLSNLGIKTPKLNKLPIRLFWMITIMNEIVNKFLLAADKVMPEMHLKQQGFTYSASGPFTKNKARIQKFKETEDASYIYKNKLDKKCMLSTWYGLWRF